LRARPRRGVLSQSLELRSRIWRRSAPAWCRCAVHAVREDALEFRLANSGAKAIVTDEKRMGETSKIRERLPYLQDIYVTARVVHAGAKIVLVVDRNGVRSIPDRRHLRDDPPSSSTPRYQREIRKGRCRSSRGARPSPNARCATISCPSPAISCGRRPTGLIGGLFDAAVSGLYHGVPVVGHRAKKFEAAGCDADDGRSRHPQRVLPPTARADADRRRQASRRQLRQHFHGRRIAWGELRTGCARPSHRRHEVFGQTECNLVVGSNQNCSDPAGLDGLATPGFDVVYRQRERRGNCRAASAASSVCASPTPAP